MMSSANAYKRVFSYASLDESWQSLLRSTRPPSRNTVGYDGKSINDFARDPKGEIRKLFAELRSENFDFSPLKPHLIPKPNGKERLICVPTVRDRIVQRSLLDFLWQRYHTRISNKISYGFIRKRTVEDAARKACTLRTAHPWVLKTDICSFFDQIDRELLNNETKRLVRERSLHPVLRSAMCCEIDNSISRSRRTRIRKLGINVGLGVRQGMPLSPLFANILLIPFDMAIEARGFHAIRYADDLIFFADSREECEDILSEGVNILHRLKLELPGLDLQTKTLIYAPNEPAEFLGLGIDIQGGTYSLRLLEKQRLEIRKKILQMGSVKELNARRVTLANLGSAISSRISGYLSAYECCDNSSELAHELSCLSKKVLKRIYRDELKIPLGALNPDARAFLGLT